MGKKSIDNICPPALRLSKNLSKFSLGQGESRRGKGGGGGGCGNVVNPIGFSIISMAGARGERGR